ncbi:Hypothetical predicted protein [Cloeon dipterum]|uniref:Uncharacterized protein n=1 Tax=Cloeon dipterum TaxID=197152 RepID=A0A8S1D3G6_9INSE|nr:Hypothetical predicted protein [Cloeon dipterum]
MMLSQGAAAGQSAGIQMKCLYCGLPDCNLEKIYKRTGTGPKYICFYCEFTERFTVVDLAKKIGVSSTYLKSQIENMEFFKTFYIERGIDVNNAPLGYLELEICEFSSSKELETVENQPDDVAEPSGHEPECSYCWEKSTDLENILDTFDGKSHLICQECQLLFIVESFFYRFSVAKLVEKMKENGFEPVPGKKKVLSKLIQYLK